MPVNPMSAVIDRAVSVGVHEDALPSSTRERYPAARIGRGFIPPLPPGGDPRKVFDRIRELARPWRDGGVYVSYKPAPREVAAGRWAAVHREIGAWLKEHPWAGIIVHHEPEGGEHRLDGETFRALFDRSRNEIKTGWPGARVAYCAMAYQWRPGGRAAQDPGPWRRVVADEYLCDVYSGMNENNGAFPAHLILPEHPGFMGWFTAIVRPRLAAGAAVTYGLGERGFMGDDGLRAATIRRESAWLATVFDRYATGRKPLDLPPSVYLAWSSVGREDEKGWLLTDDSAVAMRELTDDFARH
ncbi:hypothetical protein [Actinoplanes xinjiangensis]|uniref:GH26 domain-containing protein n=1 Tax=Actinoplanes xinjiangensis TaxID=512350 RepID=A0A316EIP9_9ACTN|nr:hypothetical protein [Actinoplanes xinjiangensis]PWK29815.1 hypothetical protein BC793_14338 [Actinoplanes xinjiangensis]GIF44846.1 hypothetical protein Axi01nite_91570 [Actinoplanes xinjiangensis]